jgi:hypothetical protein
MAMSRFARLKLATKLSALVGVFLTGFLAYTLVAWETIERIKVNGPLYREIVLAKDPVADVLPPPEYIIESYLIVLQMLDTRERAALDSFVERGKRLRLEHDAAAMLQGSDRWLLGIALGIVTLAIWLACLTAKSLVSRLQRSSVALMSTATQISATSKQQQATTGTCRHG